MDEKNLHGSIFKKLREERGYKLKDVAGDVISTRTLMPLKLMKLVFQLQFLRNYWKIVV